MIKKSNEEELLEKQKLLEDLVTLDAIHFGDFTLTSGQKSDFYIEKFRIFENCILTNLLVERLFFNIPPEIHIQIDFVAGMMTGGMLVAYAYSSISHKHEQWAPIIYLENKAFDMHIARGGTVVPGSNILIVDDVFTTGGTLRQAEKILKSKEANVIGFGVLVDRSNDKHNLSPLWSGVQITDEDIRKIKNDSQLRNSR